MLWAYKSNALGLQEQCFWTLGAMLLEAGSIAFGGWEQCFWKLGALLWEAGSMCLGNLKTSSTKIH
jgi:hypothetical protein